MSILTVAFGGCLIASLAITIDLARLHLERRENQGALDLAALSAARNLVLAEASARKALSDNGVALPSGLVVTLGSYVATGGGDPTRRFVAGGKPTNAVQLKMTTDNPVVFGRAIFGSSQKLTTVATAVNTRLASFTIGSRLASLQGGVANALLSKLLGASVSLSVMDYNSLADAKIELPKLLQAVATRAHLTAVTYDDVLNAQVGVGDLLNAIGDVLGTPTLKYLLQTLAQGANVKKISLATMIDFGPLAKLQLGSPIGLSASASVLQTVMTALGVANGGANQIDFDIGAQIPGLLALTASLNIGERPQSSPWFGLNTEGATVRTAQTRLRLNAKIGGVLGLASINLPVAVDVAASQATLSASQCGRNPKTDATATLSVTPSIGRIWIGQPKNLSRWNDMTQAADIGPATLVDVPLLLSASALSYVGVETTQASNVTFTASDMAAGTMKTVTNTSILQSALTSLTKNLSITVNLLGFTLGTPKFVTDTLAAAVSPIGALLDPVLNTLLSTLGVGLGQADVSVRGVRCDGSALVG
ncbi:TadG family pilus assembly protein [Chenggangzhangella methanolivorans]|uniref:TadG family pilus assembly protein n=1 Tax=Chenggangzhangella methanolivorans TaxID=1437009 RepID=UPI00360CE90A